MPPFGPVSRRRLVAGLREVGFDGPYSGGRHQFMVRGGTTVRLPNPHAGSVGRDLLARLLRQAGVAREDWERV